MLDFMVIAFPRSGTTWISNWLTTDQVMCHHDPLYTRHYKQLDEIERGNLLQLGISCTALWRWPDWVNSHPARKLIIHRDFDEVQQSLSDAGMPQLEAKNEPLLNQLSGLHIHFNELFDLESARVIWDYLTQLPFNQQRWESLVAMEVQPFHRKVKMDDAVIAKLWLELEG